MEHYSLENKTKVQNVRTFYKQKQSLTRESTNSKFTMIFNQLVVINFPPIGTPQIDPHNVSVLSLLASFVPMYLFEVRPLIADPNPNAFVGRSISRHVTMLVNELRQVSPVPVIGR